jgi:uncharacterized linocin/CFP29 family protein
MNNLHRELAPISEAAWAQIEEEAARTLKRYLGARKVVDLEGPKGLAHSSVGTGHTASINAPGEGVSARQRIVLPLVELRATFELSREQIDDVERGSEDSDWDALKAAAKKIAAAEDSAVFDGYAAAGIQGIRQLASNPACTLPDDFDDLPEAVSKAVNELRLAGVNGPYVLVLGEAAYTAATGEDDEGYPLLDHVKKLVDDVVWTPAIEGGVLLSTRGGDFELTVGQDFSIGYLAHTATTVELYIQETMTFRVLTTEAAVSLLATKAKKG